MIHSASEHTGFIKRIVDKGAFKESYGEYLLNLLTMYKVIENALQENSTNQVVKGFITRELYISKLIEKDIKYLLGTKADEITLLSSTKAAVSRIKDISKTKPELIVAYAYTRFLADLFGGRTFFKLFSKDYNISSEVLNYYSFEGIDDMRMYAMRYAGSLSKINLADDMKKEFIDEVNNAYIYNLAISNELETKLYSQK